MALRACMLCVGLLLTIASMRAQQTGSADGQVAVQGARPHDVLKPVPPQGANLAHVLASAKAPQLPWRSQPNYLKPPAGMHLGEPMGIARHSKGQMYVFTRLGDASRLFQFDQGGN